MALGWKLGNSAVAAATWSAAVRTVGVTQNVAASSVQLLVGTITRAINPADPDTVEIYLPGTNLALPGVAASTTSAVLNQATFNQISFATNSPIGGLD